MTNKKSLWRRLALPLVLVLALVVMPMSVLAEEVETEDIDGIVAQSADINSKTYTSVAEIEEDFELVTNMFYGADVIAPPRFILHPDGSIGLQFKVVEEYVSIEPVPYKYDVSVVAKRDVDLGSGNIINQGDVTLDINIVGEWEENRIIEVDGTHDGEIDMVDMRIIEATANINNAVINAGSNVKITTNLSNGTKYYLRLWADSYAVNSKIAGDISSHIIEEIGFNSIGFIPSVTTFALNRDASHYIYDDELNFLGMGDAQALPFSPIYYVSNAELDLGEPDNNNNNTGNNNSGSSSSSSSGGSSSGGSGGGGGSATPSNAPAPVNQASAVNQTQQAISQAIASGTNTATVTLKNVSTISLSTMQAIANAAGSNQISVNADSMSADGKTVDVRITLDPSAATKNISLSASTTSPQAKATTSLFDKYFDNSLSVVSLSQQGDFGMDVRIAAKVSPNLDISSLAFYAYDKATNTLKPITEPNYRIDSNGYVHFSTSFAGDIIISDKPLVKK